MRSRLQNKSIINDWLCELEDSPHTGWAAISVRQCEHDHSAALVIKVRRSVTYLFVRRFAGAPFTATEVSQPQRLATQRLALRSLDDPAGQPHVDAVLPAHTLSLMVPVHQSGYEEAAARRNALYFRKLALHNSSGEAPTVGGKSAVRSALKCSRGSRRQRS